MDKIVVAAILRFLAFASIMLALAWCYGEYVNAGKWALMGIGVVAFFLTKKFVAYNERRIEKERCRLKEE